MELKPVLDGLQQLLGQVLAEVQKQEVGGEEALGLELRLVMKQDLAFGQQRGLGLVLELMGLVFDQRLCPGVQQTLPGLDLVAEQQLDLDH